MKKIYTVQHTQSEHHTNGKGKAKAVKPSLIYY